METAEQDVRILRLAAKAIGVHIAQGSRIAIDGKIWNPLEDDGDALRLSVRLKIDLHFARDYVQASYANRDVNIMLPHSFSLNEPYVNDRNAATRRAIVRAAAEIG